MNKSEEKIDLIGTPYNAKAGAVVVSDIDSVMYYIDGLDSWQNNLLNKKIKVSGFLFIEEFHKSEDVRQQIVGTKKTIVQPNWHVVE